MDPVIQDITTQAASILMQNTASIVASKVQAAKAKKNDKEAVAELTEIINNLVDENAQLQSLAQAYRQELVTQQIKQEDIEYITKTALPLIDKIMSASEKPIQPEALSAIESLLSVETLSVLQLLGFNYKKAIGQPLTELIADMIETQLPSRKQDPANSQMALISVQSDLISLAKDEEAFKRYLILTGNQKQEE